MRRQSVVDEAVTVPYSGTVLALRTFGRLELVFSDTTERGTPGGKTLALLAFLSCSVTRSATRERIAELLWATSDLESAFQSIRQARSSLKRLAGRDLVHVDGTTLILSPCIQCDRDCFRDFLAKGALESAITLYRGAFCESFAAVGADEFERWAEVERSSLRSNCAEAIAKVAADALSLGQATNALTLAERLGQVDAFEERRWRIRLEALMLKHDAFGAAIASSECCAWLAGENREPSRALRNLLDRAGQSTIQDGTIRGNTESAHALHPDLVGRERQFGTLLKSWEQVGAGESVCVAVIGKAGIGKSRLLNDIHERLTASRARVASLRALPAESGIAFSLVSRLAATVATMPGAAGLSESSAATLLALNPSLSAHFPGVKSVPPYGDPTLAYIEALDDLLSALTDNKRLALLIDDLHWSDGSSRQVLASIGERHTSRRLLIVLAMRGRHEQAGRIPASARLVTIESLTVEESEAMLASIARVKEEQSRDWVFAVHRATDGNPLMILETLRLAMDAGLLSIEQSTWVLKDETALEVMLAKRSMMGDRLSRLDPDARQIALALSIAGRPIEANALLHVVTQRTAHGATALQLLEVHDVAAPRNDGWSIVHDVLAETLIVDSDPSEMRLARALAANALRRSISASGLTAALHQYAELKEWDECIEVLTEIVRKGYQGEKSRVERTAAALATLSDGATAGEIRRRLPWSLRYPVRRMSLAVGLTFACGLALLTSRGSAASAAVPSTLLAFYGSPQIVGVPVLRLDTASRGVQTAIDIDRAPREVGWPSIGHPVALGAPGEATAIDRVYDDSGGVDVVLWYPGGREERLTAVRGDDVPNGWSPDGSSLLIESSRAGVMGHRAIYRIDPETRDTRRISTGGSRTVSDMSASWSPDGSRIAFSRKHFDVAPDELCTVDVDGTDEECRPLGGQALLSTAGWLDAKHVVVWTDSAAVERTEIADVVTGTLQRAFADFQLCRVSPDGLWWACSSTHPDGLTVAPVSAPASLRDLRLPEGALSGQLGFPLSAKPHRLVSALEISSPMNAVPVGVGTTLSSVAITVNGDRVVAPRLRWSLDDTTRGIVQGGILIPSRPGPMVVRATLGGWRSASLRLNAVAMPSSVRLVENWAPGYEERWRTFGVPAPTAVREGDRYAFWNNGDGSFLSGAYTTRNYDATSGIWVEASLKIPITLTQWQSAALSIENSGGARLAAWGHREGNRPGGKWSWCYFGYPTGEGAASLHQVQGGGGDISARLGYPVDSLSRGQWFRVLLQLLPDGRCATAIDGVPVHISAHAPATPDSSVVIVQGNSYSTRVLVGALTIGYGVRADVPWRILETPARPRSTAVRPAPRD